MWSSHRSNHVRHVTPARLRVTSWRIFLANQSLKIHNSTTQRGTVLPRHLSSKLRPGKSTNTCLNQR